MVVEKQVAVLEPVSEDAITAEEYFRLLWNAGGLQFKVVTIAEITVETGKSGVRREYLLTIAELRELLENTRSYLSDKLVFLGETVVSIERSEYGRVLSV